MSDKSEPITSPPVTSSVEGTHAQGTRSLGSVADSTIPGRASGPSSLVSLASYETQGGPLGTSSWKTSQRSLLGGWVEYSGTWPRSGMMRSGTAYPLRPSAPITAEIGSLSSGRWPTPTAGDARGSGSRNTENSKAHAGISLTDAVRGDGGKGRTWPTPRASDADRGGRGELLHCVKTGTPRGAGKQWPTHTASDWKGSSKPGQRRGQLSEARTIVGGKLNPAWVEWLMGFPIGWTDCDASEMP